VKARYFKNVYDLMEKAVDTNINGSDIPVRPDRKRAGAKSYSL